MNSTIMKSFGITKRSIVVGILFLSVIGIGIFVALDVLDRWTQDIVQTNTRLTKESVHKISTASQSLIDSLWRNNFFSTSLLSRSESMKIDSLFSAITAEQVVSIKGMEGGFYLRTVDEMVGYSWPTSPPPKPAYGPAPRSFPTIKAQILESIAERAPLVEFHSYDFAIYPLSTEPIWVNDSIIGAVWARIHVEKELPKNQLAKILNIAAIIAIGALGAVLILLWIRKLHIDAIRVGLEEIRRDQSHRLPESSGVYGIINRSINRMVDALMDEQQKREHLERELHQQDKMATLGKLIAGVAHEVKTPLAVIKTRVQMWQRDRKLLAHTDQFDAVIQPDSMQLVVEEIDRLSRLVKRLLLFSKPASQKVQHTNIALLLEQVCTLIADEAKERSIHVAVAHAAPLPPIAVDAQSLEQVFLNICMNALEAMRESGTLRIGSTFQSGVIELTFDDDGKGIDPSIRRNIFDPFFTTKDHGVGLGLSIAYEIIKSHGGSIEFTAPPGGPGTRCIVRLPIDRKDASNER
jgi:signal transduction histidine kinase